MRRLLLVAGLLVLTAQAPAHAADRVDRVAAALRQSPVFVDPDVSYLLDARQRADLETQIRGVGVPVYLAAVPLVSQDESGGDGEYLAYLLHRRLGLPGIYLIVGPRDDVEWMSYQVPRSDDIDFDLVTRDEPVPKKLHDILDAFRRAPYARPLDPATPRAPEPDRNQRPSNVALVGHFTRSFALALALGGVALSLLWLMASAVLTVVRAVRGASARTLGARKVRRTATAQLVRLAKAIGAAEYDGEGKARAMADYDAARILYDEQHDPGSLFGVVVLALDGQDALRENTGEPKPRCLLDPFHGTAGRKVRTLLPGLPRADRPLCDACRRTRERDRRPLTLKIDGRMIPYYRAPGLWERLKGTTKNLPARVLEYLGVG
jgi:hypothetical protein